MQHPSREAPGDPEDKNRAENPLEIGVPVVELGRDLRASITIGWPSSNMEGTTFY